MFIVTFLVLNMKDKSISIIIIKKISYGILILNPIFEKD